VLHDSELRASVRNGSQRTTHLYSSASFALVMQNERTQVREQTGGKRVNRPTGSALITVTCKQRSDYDGRKGEV
jgi:hypothetical protein